MHSKEPVIDDASEGEVIERVHENIIDFLVVFIETLRPEVEETCHLSALVVTSKEVNSLWIGHLQGVQEEEHLD